MGDQSAAGLTKQGCAGGLDGDRGELKQAQLACLVAVLVQRAPLSTNGERVGDYHHKFEGGKAVPAVVMPPQAHRELQGKQNKTCACAVHRLQPEWTAAVLRSYNATGLPGMLDNDAFSAFSRTAQPASAGVDTVTFRAWYAVLASVFGSWSAPLNTKLPKTVTTPPRRSAIFFKGRA